MYCTYGLNTVYTSDYVTNILHNLLWLFLNYEHSYSSPELNNKKIWKILTILELFIKVCTLDKHPHVQYRNMPPLQRKIKYV